MGQNLSQPQEDVGYDASDGPSEVPTPNSSRKLSHPPQMPSSPTFGSSIDLSVSVDHSPLSDALKRKKRRKKRLKPASDLGHDHPSLVPHPSMELDTPAIDGEQQGHEVICGDAEIGDAFMSTIVQSQRTMEKQKKKEERRAAKRARREQTQQGEDQLVSSLVNAEEPNHLAEILYPQEHIIAATGQQAEEEEPEAYAKEPAKHWNTSSMKRKRRSRSQTEDASDQISKKSKSPGSGKGVVTMEQDTPAPDDVIKGPKESGNSDANYKDLVEQHYASPKKNKRKSRDDTTLGPEEYSRVMDVGDEMDPDLSGNGRGADEASGLVEMYPSGDINHVYNYENSVNMASEAISTSHIITTHRSSSFSRDPDDNGNAAHGSVEIPSSIPCPSSADKSSSIHNATNKTSTRRKRVAKPAFLSGTVNELVENIDFQSPSTAVLLRRADKGKDKLVANSEYEAPTSPLITNGKTRQRKIGDILDRDVAMTPSTASVNRKQTPTTPITSSGAFSELEIRNLSRAIERFRDDHNMTQQQVNELIHSNPKVHGGVELWEGVVATCPGRSRQKVIDQTRRRFHNFVARGAWTTEQDQELRRLYEQCGNKYALIGQIVNRHPEDIRDRIRNYVICGGNLKNDRWSQDEVDQLIEIVEQASTEIRLQRANRGQDNDQPIEEDINWQLVSQSMGRTRSRLQCITKWRAVKKQLAGDDTDADIVQQARDTAATMSYRNRCIIVQEILKTGAIADSRIPWLKIRQELGGQWTRPSLIIIWFRLKRAVSEWQSLNVQEICTILLQRFQSTQKLDYPSDESGDLDYHLEYLEIESKIRRGRKFNMTPKSTAFISKASDDNVGEEEGQAEETVRGQLDKMREQAAEQTRADVNAILGHRAPSVDLGIGGSDERAQHVEDSEPGTTVLSRRRRRSTRSRETRSEPQDFWHADSDDQSSNTNASQVSSIPAR
ncbi:hypothetical protein GGR51DRAFT_542506 [Nemania sp. FL0031]|nr:hypothetical protein GGR51DRAFT_542506 [Nemania sp. FL0031]